MAVLALGLAGSALGASIGGTVLGMSAASIGWAVGSTLGSILSQPNQQVSGPRLGDLSVQSSTYGQPVPIGYGAVRVSGNVIYSTDKREVVSSSRSRGKGGPKVTTTSYSYNVDIAIGLMDSNVIGLRRVWSNGKLVFDARTDASLESVLGSNLNALGVRLYTGTEDQLPDPVLESNLGIGNVPAYRGHAYVVFEQLDCPNGQTPQLSFEVVTAGGVTPYAVGFPSTIPGTLLNPSLYDIGSTVTDQNVYHTYTDLTSTPGITFVALSFTPNGLTPIPFTPYPDASLVRTIWHGKGLGYPAVVVASSTDENVDIVAGSPIILTLINLLTQDTQTIASFNSDTIAPSFWRYPLASNASRSFTKDPISGKYVFSTGSSVGGQRLAIIGEGGGIAYSSPNGVAEADSVSAYDGLGVVAMQNTVVIYDLDTGGIVDTLMPFAAPGTFVVGVCANEFGIFVVGRDTSGNYRFMKVYPDGVEELGYLTAGGDYGLPSIYGDFWCDGTRFTFGLLPVGASTNYTAISGTFDAISISDTPLSSVIVDLCSQGGLGPTDVDASACTDLVQGYLKTRVGSIRSALEPLIQAYFIDVQEADGKLVFFPRSTAATVASIPWVDLATMSGPFDSSADPNSFRRVQDQELPRSINVNYMNVDADYQSGSELAQRILPVGQHDTVVDLPLVFTPDDAAAIAYSLLYDAWNDRNTYSVKVGQDYSYLCPGDIVTLEYPEGVYSTVRLTETVNDGEVVSLSYVLANGDVLLPLGYGASGAGGQVSTSYLPDASIQILDIPILRNDENFLGTYVAFADRTGWPGAELFVGANESDLSSRFGVSLGTAFGSTLTVLGDWTLGVVDQINYVDIQVISGEFGSNTYSGVLNNSEGAVLIGSEVLHYISAVDLGDNVYRLTGFLRGARGTGWATGSHVQGERVVLLQAQGMAYVSLASTDLFVPRVYRPVTYGKNYDDAPDYLNVSQGVSMKPFAPMNVRRVKNVSTDAQELSWDGVTRAVQAFPMNGVEVPLYETTEEYSVRIYTSDTFTTLVRTLTTTSNSVSYSAADQVSDFGVLQDVVHAIIYQVGSVGLGYPKEASV
jgi:hypothetical protein